MSRIRQVKVPPLVGRQEAAAILGCHAQNLRRDFPELPPPLAERDIPGFDIGRTSAIWPLDEVLAVRALRRKVAA